MIQRINPNGGAIALGHPLGMSGTRIIQSATNELIRKNKRYALITMCIGVGQGYATIIEKNMIYEFNGYKPVIHPSSFVHKEATIIGNVIIGENVYIGPGASLRGDWGQLNVGNGCNVQDNCILHIFPGKDVILEENAHIGHGAIVHGAHIGEKFISWYECSYYG